MDERMSDTQTQSTKRRKICKVLVAMVLFIIMVGGLMTNKFALVWLMDNKMSSHNDIEAWYAAVGLVVMVPEVYALVLVLWHTSFIKQTPTHQWPCSTAIFVGFLVCFAEVSSHLMLMLEVAPRLPIQILLPVLSSVYGITLSHQQWETFKVDSEIHPEMAYDVNFTLAQKSTCSHDDLTHEHHLHTGSQNWKRVLRTIFGFSGMWSSCAIAGIVALTTPLPWFPALCLPACLCLLSLCWHPKVQIYSIKSSDGTFNGRWKATCAYTITKLLVSFIGLSLFMGVQFRQSSLFDYNFFHKLLRGLYLCKQPGYLIPLLLHFASSIACHMFGFVAVTLCLPEVAITLPCIIATPASVGIMIYLCTTEVHWLQDVTCFHSGTGIWCACGLAFITWLAPFIVHGIKLCKKSNVILKPYTELFIQPTWNGMFLEQHFTLNYKHDGFTHITPEVHHHATPNNRKPKIFICTTMYREADFEMARLLVSLRKVATSDKLKHTYMETHIFLDQGTKDLHLTDFGSQLVSLLKDKLNIQTQNAAAYVTPYGIQLIWTLETGMPFYIHLKDPGKVKPKKRWSQVMYMSYVLNFRMHQDSSQGTLGRSSKEPNIDPSIFVGYASDKEWNKNNVSLNHSGEAGVMSTPPFLDCAPSRSQSIIREHQQRIRARSRIIDHRKSKYKYQKSALNSSTESETMPTTSSDQGIGNSDEISISSISVKYDALDTSSEAGDSPGGSFRNYDSSWQDYEGDISSNNENSLTSLRAKHYNRRVKEAFRNEVIYESAAYTGLTLSKAWRYPRSHPYRTHGTRRHPKRPHSREHKSAFRQDTPSTYPKLLTLARSTEHNQSAMQVMHTFSDGSVEIQHTYTTMQFKKPEFDEDTYILATDADMEFTPESVESLLGVCSRDRRLGGACGRTHPIGQRSGPLLWYQMFEYAKDFWMIKSAQNVIGSVMCCPGCFSLYRVGAIRDVMQHYAGPTSQPFDVFIKDTGEDRWLCTLMMLRGWKLEYTAFCSNTTFCPTSLREFLTQRRRWVLSDIANMLLVLKYILTLARRNDSFSIAYILYLAQMFAIVLLSPASTMVILAGGLEIVYGLPFQLMAPLLGVITLAYVVVCLLCTMRTQVKVTLALTLMFGLAMLLVVIGGAVYVVQHMKKDWADGSIYFQEYHLILLLIGALLFAALLHPTEMWTLCHGVSYLLGFPAMQILLPVYAACNIVDQTWGTRDHNQSKSPPVTCFARNRKKYHSSLSRKSKRPAEDQASLHTTEHAQTDSRTSPQAAADADNSPTPSVDCTLGHYKHMTEGHLMEEYVFWRRLADLVIGQAVNQGLSGNMLALRLRALRNICLISLIILNTLWLILLSVLYFNVDMNLARVNIYGLIAAAVYGLVLFIQLIGMTMHRVQATFARLAMCVFGEEKPVWVYSRTY